MVPLQCSRWSPGNNLFRLVSPFDGTYYVSLFMLEINTVDVQALNFLDYEGLPLYEFDDVPMGFDSIDGRWQLTIPYTCQQLDLQVHTVASDSALRLDLPTAGSVLAVTAPPDTGTTLSTNTFASLVVGAAAGDYNFTLVSAYDKPIVLRITRTPSSLSDLRWTVRTLTQGAVGQAISGILPFPALGLAAFSPTFNPAVRAYTLTLPYLADQMQLTLTAAVEDVLAMDGLSFLVQTNLTGLEVGTRTFTLRTSLEGSYRFTVTRLPQDVTSLSATGKTITGATQSSLLLTAVKPRESATPERICRRAVDG